MRDAFDHANYLLASRVLCLSTFITTLCENGEVTKFCRYAFVGMEAEVEKTLLFKARNTDINASPNYFRIIYSYSVFRSDFRNGNYILRSMGTR